VKGRKTKGENPLMKEGPEGGSRDGGEGEDDRLGRDKFSRETQDKSFLEAAACQGLPTRGRPYRRGVAPLGKEEFGWP